MSLNLIKDEVEYNMVTKSPYYIQCNMVIYNFRNVARKKIIINGVIVYKPNFFLPMVQEEIQHLGRGSKDHFCSIFTSLFALQTSTPESSLTAEVFERDFESKLIKHNLV